MPLVQTFANASARGWGEFLPSGASNSYELISTTLLSTTTSSVTFDVTGLGSIYKHLQIRHTTRADVDAQTVWGRFNSDTGNNYSAHRLFGYNSSVISDAFISRSTFFAGSNGSSDLPANIFGASVVDILDPFSTSKNKTLRTLSGFHGAAPGGNLSVVHLQSSAYYSTSAVTSVTLFPNAGNFVSGSRLSIYGLKG